MKVIYKISDWKEKASVATIGFFDGVHTGHRFLLQELRAEAKKSRLPSAIITFPVHPRYVLFSDYQPKLLNTFEERIELLSLTGIDYLIVTDFTAELSGLTARAFISTALVDEWHVKKLFIGYDHRFGYQRTEGFEQYMAIGREYGMEVIRTSSFSSDTGMAVSSSKIRSLIETGDVSAASRLLGYPYRLKGRVVSGNKMGRLLGFPTANIAVDEKLKLIPQRGSYAVRITVDHKNYRGMLYIGLRPTIGGEDSIRIEVNIFDFSGEIYDRPILVEFVAFIREDRKFDSLDELREQMQEDKKKAEHLINGT